MKNASCFHDKLTVCLSQKKVMAMDNLFSAQEAEAYVKKYQAQNINQDRALRVYTSRLLGAESKLVLHGGGNTSVKTTSTNLLGETIEVLCVKGSGWDLITIEPEGFPALKLQPLLQLRQLSTLSDEAMVNFQRGQLLDANAPNPSIETLLHAFLPHRFIDHTHANAILSLTNQPDGESLIRKIFGKHFGIVPYIKPGFNLAKLAVKIYEENSKVYGLILLHHGIFTFADTAEASYTRMIDAVSQAENYIRDNKKNTHITIHVPHPPPASEIAPLLRGACAIATPQKRYKRMIVCYRNNELIQRYVNGTHVSRYSQVGVATPDHIIRTKNFPLLLHHTESFIQVLDTYKVRYQQYFLRHNRHQPISKIALDPIPRIVLMPGVGLFALGKTAQEANINADIAESTMITILDATRIGTYTALNEAALFEMEYWSLEQAKLAKQTDNAFTRQVVVITGSAGTIGAATAKAFANLGAEIVLLDVHQEACEALAKQLSPYALAISCDITQPTQVKQAFQKICATFGGVDNVIFNAGCAYKGKIGEVSDEILRKSFEINFFAHQCVAQHAIAIMKKQQTGGNLLFNVSKQALNPGVDFGPYGLAKAATLALVRQYAIDYADQGIRANAVNADRIRSGLLTDDMITERAAARGVSIEEYMSGNLLKLEVTAEDVAQAFVHQALSHKTTAAIMTVDGGNIAAAVR